MELDWSVEREGDASLVGFRVRNDGAVPRRVRIESRLKGPVLPPRRGGVAEAGWDAAGVTAVVSPGERETFGFAALADAVEPPVEIASVESVDPGKKDTRAADETGSDLARAAVRDLETHCPPRRAVTGAIDPDDRGEAGRGAGETARNGNSVDRRGGEAGGGAEAVESTVGSDSGRAATAESTSRTATADEIDAWFASVETRIDRAERLTDADLATATAVVEEAGGLDAVDGLDERVAADAERLKAIRDRAAALAERAEESEVPTEALEALA
ncbi:hypothetical protein [Halorubrum sp. AS12]|uniref:DUF7857 domain-containing protein n=1 Tax=Halorubrum sp. AS12 TaxID=3409687 RepID=UPI003DA71A4B